MKRLDIEQGSEEWKAWRRNMVTATDAGAILGVNPFKTRYQLWRQKLQLDPEEDPNDRMLEGQRLEPIARDLFIKELGTEVYPAVCVSSQYEFMGASIDGLSKHGQVAVEIKCSKKIYEQACEDFIEEYYEAQIQHQMQVLGLDSIFFMAYWDDKYKILCRIKDHKFIDKMIHEEKQFYDCLQSLTPPVLIDKDYVQRQDAEWESYSNLCRYLKENIKEKEKALEKCREKLIEMSGGQNTKGCGLTLQKIVSKGRVDYNRMVDELNIDIEKYRKEKTETYRIDIDE